MKIAFLAIGSRGDVQPFISLGVGLKARGHDVRIVAPAGFEALAAEAGLEYRTIPGDPDGFFRTPGVIESLQKSPSMVRVGRALPKVSATEMSDGFEVIQKELIDVDLVVNAMFTRALQIADPITPWATTSWWPTATTSEFPALGAPRLPLGGLYNRFTHAASARVEWQLGRQYVNHFRKRRNRPPFGFRSPLRALGREIPVLYPYSPSFMPPPADWPERCHVTGFWFWDREREPHPEMVSFLGSGLPPVVLALGSSWAIHRPETSLRLVLEAARGAGRRVLMVGGPRDGLPEDVFRVDDVDYTWLLPQAATVVHHAGFGTMAAVLRAGVPHVTIPTFADQPYWTGQLERHGVVRSVPYQKLNGEQLSKAIHTAVNDPVMRANAAELGARIQRERGVDTACDVLESWMAEKHPAATGS